jgi:hypothetical protein
MWVVLGIESSCDDTAAAVVRGDGTVLSHCIASQVGLISLQQSLMQQCIVDWGFLDLRWAAAAVVRGDGTVLSHCIVFQVGPVSLQSSLMHQCVLDWGLRFAAGLL